MSVESQVVSALVTKTRRDRSPAAHAIPVAGLIPPLAVTLMKPEIDQFEPGEHNGTFRGHNPAFVTATAALETYWTSNELSKKVNRDAVKVRDVMLGLADEFDAEVRGRGMIQGIEFADKSLAGQISQEAFRNGLIIETAGPSDEVLKALPPLTIEADGLDRGLDIMQSCARKLAARVNGRVPSTVG